MEPVHLYRHLVEDCSPGPKTTIPWTQRNAKVLHNCYFLKNCPSYWLWYLSFCNADVRFQFRKVAGFTSSLKGLKRPGWHYFLMYLPNVSQTRPDEPKHSGCKWMHHDVVRVKTAQRGRALVHADWSPPPHNNPPNYRPFRPRLFRLFVARVCGSTGETNTCVSLWAATASLLVLWVLLLRQHTGVNSFNQNNGSAGF